MNMENGFIKVNTRGAGTAYTENGAVSYASTGLALTDQFAKAGTARGRDYETVWNEQAQLWNEDKELALRFPFYLRLITRKSNLLDDTTTEKVQRGQGARDEAFKRLLWFAAFHEDEFYRNLWVLPIVGSWKDIWVILSMAMNDEMPVSFKIDTNKVFEVIAQGIHSKSHVDLVKKYMPRLRSNNKCKTTWAISTNLLAKMFCEFAGWTPKEYRQFKSTGRAHTFQRDICAGKFDAINWSLIPGKALLNLVSGKFLENHGLTDSYIKWLKEQPTVKFNGYAFELGHKLGGEYGKKVSLATTITVDKQFEALVATGNADGGAIKGNVLCALDTSGSMGCPVTANGVTAYDVCVSLGIYFSALNQGAFHNTVAMFDNTSSLLKLQDGTFSEKLKQIRQTSTAWGGTNFQSLIDLIVNTRKRNPNIPLEDYPTTLLVVSDMQFNPSDSYYGGYSEERERTNYEAAMAKLRKVFPEEFVDNFKIVWWFCSSRNYGGYAPISDVPSTIDDKGTFVVSGFDGAIISALLGDAGITNEAGEKEQPSMEDLAKTALSQEVLMLVA